MPGRAGSVRAGSAGAGSVVAGRQHPLERLSPTDGGPTRSESAAWSPR